MKSHPPLPSSSSPSSASSSSSSGLRLLLVAVLCLLISRSTVSTVHEAELARLCSHYLHHRDKYEESSAASFRRVPTWCSRFPSFRAPPQPSADTDDVDLRYGVDKRLVPTGPNPLHN